MLCLLFLAGITPQLEKSIFKIQLRNKINRDFIQFISQLLINVIYWFYSQKKTKCFHQNVYNMDTSK